MIEQAIRVLSIEDNPADAMLIQEKLAEAQRVGWDLPRFEIEHVDRLEAALTRLNAGGKFDVVLSDLDLPDSRAGETVATLREHIPHMPLVVLTGREDEVLAHKSVRVGVQDYVYKNEATGSLLARSMMYAIERQEARATLEQRVAGRTKELHRANQELKAEIAERERTEKALRGSEEKYRRLVELSPDLIAIHLDGEVLYINKAGANLLGFSDPAQVIGKSITEFVTPAHRDVSEERMRRLVKEGQQSPVYEQTIVRPDGTKRDVEVVGIPFTHQDGTAVQIIAHDVTERKRMERQLRENEARYKKAQRLGQVGNWEYNVQTARFWGSDEAKRIYGFDPAAEDFSVDEVESCIPERERVHQALVDLIEKNAEYDLEFEIYPKNSDHAKTIVSIAELERDGRGNPLKVTGVIHDITERKQIEVALKESEEKFKKLAEYAPVPISIIAFEDETRFLYVNREWERSRGYTRDDLDTVSPIDTVHPDMRPTVLENARKRMEGHNVPDRYELKVVTKSGETQVLDFSVTPIEYANQKRILTIAVDITERKRAAEALKASEQRHRRLLNTLQEGIWAIDAEACTTFVNPQMAEMLGYTVEEMQRESLFTFMEDQDVEVAKRNLARRREGVQEQHEFRFLHRDGHHVYTLVETAPILDEEGRYDGALAGVIDITERKQAEEALRESERRHRELADNIPGAVYQFHIGPDETFSVPYMSASGAELFERPLEELMDEAPPFDDIHPDDRADFLQSIAEAAQTMRRWSHEFRTITPTEKIKWLHGSSNPRHLPDGSILWDGVLLNITARKRAEEALQESKALLAKAEQLAHLGSWEWDIEPDQFTLSEGWQRVHGCHIGQLSSETLLPIAHPDDRARIEQAFDQALKGQQPYDIEHRIIRQDDGEVRIIQAYGEVIRDAHGNPIKMYGATLDITERKRAEHALQQRNRRLAELNAIVSSLTSTLSLEEVLQRILEATPQFFSQEHSATIQLLEEDGNLHQRADSSNIPAEKQQNIFRPGEGIAGRAIQEQRPINVADVTADPDYLPGPIPPHYRSLLVVPLIAHNQPLGTLSLSSRRVEAFDDRDIERLQGLAGYAAIAVYNAQLYEQTRRDAETKDLLLREVNHRVKNNLNAIIGLLYVERRHAPPEALPAYRPIMDDLTQRITGLSEVHQMLSGGEWAPLNLGELAERIIQVTVRGAQDDVDVTLDVSPASVYVQAAQAQHLALILSELTTNTLKYGAKGRDVVHIAVRITQQDGIVTLTYRNDGPGYAEDVLSLERHSAGLDIVKRSVHKNLRGELTLRNEDGAVTEIRFKSEE